MYLSIDLKHILLCLISIYNFATANDVHGCGGYIQSGVTINYSNVKIKLLSHQGSLKYETECAPNNGYYFLPIYDKGNYILKVSPPPGWKFEPEKVEINFDGETDICSQGKDVDFHFQGFSVVGKVISSGSNSGPAGVIVTLKRDGKEILRTETSEDGKYIFSPLPSGQYIVVASHQHFVFSKNQASVTVQDSNGDAGNTLIIEGYKLSGKTTLRSKFFNDVSVTLHGNVDKSSKLGCIAGAPSTYLRNEALPPILCHTPINEDGSFSFTKLPTGRYTIAPFFSSMMRYQIAPSSLDAEVKHDDVSMTQFFSVTGGELVGRILSGNGNGLKGVRVSLDGTLSVISDVNGKFIFPNVQFGSHILSHVFDEMEFNDEKISYSLSNLEVAAIRPARYRTCFSVNLDSTSDIQEEWLIIISQSGRAYKNIYTKSNTKGCLFLPPGVYTAAVKLSESSIKKGIRFGPTEHSFSVTTSPIENLRFSQFLGEIHGTIICKAPCPPLTLSLRSVREDFAEPRVVRSEGGKFFLKEVIPGDYRLSIDMEDWCWQESSLDVTVDRKRVEVHFTQVGYLMKMAATHSAVLEYAVDGKVTGVIEVSEGTSSRCMIAPGQYTFKPTGCQQIRKKTISWDTTSPKLVSVAATHFKITGAIRSKEESTFSVNVLSSTSEKKVINLPSSSSPKNVFTFEYWAADGESISFVPSSPAELFKFSPSSYNVTMRSACLSDVVTFVAERSLFLKGSVKPPVTDAIIVMEEASIASRHEINSEGLFIIGPLSRDQTYVVTAEKIGYVFNPPSYTFDLRNQVDQVDVIRAPFEAHKLAEIVVTIVDESGAPLEGVLVSTSGGKDYRQNSLTGDKGSFVFHSLMPNEYFLRPMMKEYDFEPSSKTVYVEGGKTVNVFIRGIRVAYSIYGKTYSINGQQESDIVLEAVTVGKKCGNLPEEATSDSSGQFRIRGLKPKCDYEISLKDGSDFRCIPKKFPVRVESSDVRDVNLIVMRPFHHMEVIVEIKTENKYLPHLSVEVYREDLPDSPIHVVKVNNFPFVMLPPMTSDKRSYFVQLSSTLPTTKFEYTLPLGSFMANTSFKRLELSFQPELKSIEAEISQSAFIGFVLFFMVVIAIFNYERLIILYEKGYEYYTEKQAARQMPQESSDSPHIEPVNVKRRVKPRKI